MMMLTEIACGIGHYFAYDLESMQNILKEAGFTEIRQTKPDKTAVEAFKKLDRENPWRMAMTLHVEAMRP